jgi:sugar phosphate isomerase/epimerase
MKPGFMSSVVPKQNLVELMATAKKYGYQGIEFRVEWDHAHGIELTATPDELRQARSMLQSEGIAASCIATGVKFNSEERADHVPQREALRKYITLAAEVSCPYLRTFADTLPEDEAARDKVLNLAAESYTLVDDWATQHGVGVLVETHTNMSGKWARQIIDQAKAPSLHVLWHAGHHLRRGQSVDETYPYIRRHVRHVHYQAMAREHVTDEDNLRVFQLLYADSFPGFLSVEYINPDNPDQVLAENMGKYREYMRAIQSTSK